MLAFPPGLGKNMPYCRVFMENVVDPNHQREAKETSKLEFGNPVTWNQAFTFLSTTEDIGDAKLVFQVVNGNPFLQEEEVYGTATLLMRQLKDALFEGTLELTKDKGKAGQKGHRGNLTLKVTTQKMLFEKTSAPTAAGSNRLTVSSTEYADFKNVCQLVVQVYFIPT